MAPQEDRRSMGISERIEQLERLAAYCERAGWLSTPYGLIPELLREEASLLRQPPAAPEGAWQGIAALRALEAKFYTDEGEGLGGARLFRCRVCGKGGQEGGSWPTGRQHHRPCPVDDLALLLRHEGGE